MDFSPTIIGIDVGGTFTDFVVRENGSTRVLKIPSTPDDQSRAILAGLEVLGITSQAQIVHGSTVATNALLERRGARTALLTTQGFADVIEIGRQNRSELYSLRPTRPETLVPRQWRFEVAERLDAHGKVLCALDEKAVREIAAQLRSEHIESLAIVFLFSFLDATHEQRAAAILREALPDLKLSLSSEILPEYREFERTSTTVINAYVQPKVEHYLGRLNRGLQSGYGGARLSIMQSNGGAIDWKIASEQAARLVLSGPAGGVVGAFACARQAMQTDSPHILTLDMGGTSTDVALLPGRVQSTSESAIAGFPLRLPVIDIETVGAGGGSLARVDEAGVLHVGPQSAGAIPGPACYNRGGTQATVSDANVVLGRLHPQHFLGGEMPLNEQAARAVIAPLAEALGMTVEETALGIVQVANVSMERALRRVSIERGHDPREFILLPFGGAGPLHACELAASLGITRVLIPQSPGALSALGMTVADTIRDESRALLGPLQHWSEDTQIAATSLTEMRVAIESTLPDEANIIWQPALDLRYRGQSYELTIALPDVNQSTLRDAFAQAAHDFHEAHQSRYGFARRDAAIESTVLRLRGVVAAHELPDERATEATTPAEPFSTSQVWFGDGPYPTALFHREPLQPGHHFDGPALVFQLDCTTVVPPYWNARVDAWRNLVLSAE